jgi:predicted negative regulator of RcsB-dependent stress response
LTLASISAISCIYTLRPICFVHGFYLETHCQFPPMSTPAPITPNQTPASTGESTVTPGFEHKLHDFWQRNSKAVYLFCLIVLVAIIGKGAYGSYRVMQDNKVRDAYAAASTSEKLKAFATENAGHALAGVAWLRLADEAYAAGNYALAAQNYQAASTMKDSPLAGRATLGLAIAKLQAGQASEAETLLKQISSDAKQMKGIRAEAAYQLASTASAAGRTDEALKYLDQVTAIEPTGTWAQRAMMLRITLPAPTLAAPAISASPAIASPAKP